MKHIKSRKSFLSKEGPINEVNVNDEDFGEDKKDEVKYEFGCIMLKINRNDEWNKAIESIDEEDVYESEEEPGRFGIEYDPHVTVLYGTHDNEIDKDDISEKILDREAISLNIVNISIFENDDYDVLKFGVESEDLMKFNKDLTEEFPYTNDYDYHPHATIAYLKPGTGKKYTKTFEEEEIMEFEGLNEITYSRVEDGEKEKIKLTLTTEDGTEGGEENIDKSKLCGGYVYSDSYKNMMKDLYVDKFQTNENMSDEEISKQLANMDVPDLLEESNKGSIKKGDKIEVEMKLLQGSPSYKVLAEKDSWFHEGVELFSFLLGGDMMMIAKNLEGKWISG